jgi:putative resolvase
MNKLFSLVENQASDAVLIEYPDRLVRFGLPYLEQAFGGPGVRLEVLEQRKPLEPTEELTQDLLIAVFSGKLYGYRGHGKAQDGA